MRAFLALSLFIVMLFAVSMAYVYLDKPIRETLTQVAAHNTNAPSSINDSLGATWIIWPFVLIGLLLLYVFVRIYMVEREVAFA